MLYGLRYVPVPGTGACADHSATWSWRLLELFYLWIAIFYSTLNVPSQNLGVRRHLDFLWDYLVEDSTNTDKDGVDDNPTHKGRVQIYKMR